jgi:hypothetical protein
MTLSGMKSIISRYTAQFSPAPFVTVLLFLFVHHKFLDSIHLSTELHFKTDAFSASVRCSIKILPESVQFLCQFSGR